VTAVLGSAKYSLSMIDVFHKQFVAIHPDPRTATAKMSNN
jgi:hypothetical protein